MLVTALVVVALTWKQLKYPKQMNEWIKKI